MNYCLIMPARVTNVIDRSAGVADRSTLRQLYWALLARLQPDVCCDIGTHDGEAALRALEASPRSVVYAFEANPEIFQAHQSRLTKATIRAYNLAITDCTGELTLYAPRRLTKRWTPEGVVAGDVVEGRATGKTSILRRAEEASYTEFRVRSQTLDNFFREEKRAIGKTTFALWIDVEGAAAQVLAGAEEVLESTAVVFVEVEGYSFWENQRTADFVTTLLSKRGFVALARDREYGDDQFNVLFVKPGCLALLEDSLASLPVYPPHDLPVIIPCFNNLTHVRAMIEQLARVGLRNLILVDNASSFPPFQKYLAKLERSYVIIRKDQNEGPRRLFQKNEFYQSLPQFFCITDPDLEFNPRLPGDFIARLIELTEKHRVGKAGFALDISEPERLIQEPFQIGEERCRIWEWEARFWQTPLGFVAGDPVYRASIDTTFAVYNKAFFANDAFLEAVRLAGRFTARHLPWYRDHQLPEAEAAFYHASSRHSFYGGQPPRF